jgi:transposase
VECEPGDPVLRDRLYLNEGNGHFARSSPDTLPDVRDSGSATVAADFDRDGDLDPFVGGRSVPGKYPLIPRSRLFRNEGGVFADATDQVALEALKGIKTVSEIAREFEVHRVQVSQWKKEIQERLPEIFGPKPAFDEKKAERQEESLHQKIGQLTIEVDWLKKSASN